MDRAQIKDWAKKKIKGHVWEILIAIIITSLLTGLTVGQSAKWEDGKFIYHQGYQIGAILFCFVNVGFAAYMIKFVNDKERSYKELFDYYKDFVRIFVTQLLSGIFIMLWTLLLIVPGIIKAISYSLVNIILSDEKYKDLSYMDVLKKSETLMNGHKMDYFVLQLSFIGWHLLAILTLGILEIWIAPYQETATYKFLNDIIKEDK